MYLDAPLLDARLVVKRSCSDGELLGWAQTADSQTFSMVDQSGSSLLHLEPGWYGLCYCNQTLSQCDQAPDFANVLGVLISQGPYPNQSAQCVLGQLCVLSPWRGVGLSINDSVIVGHQCGIPNATTSHGQAYSPVRIHGSTDEWSLHLGHLDLNEMPQVVDLCWCPASASCKSVQHFRASAYALRILCPPGSYESEGSCKDCPVGSWCPDGLRTESCPASSSSATGSSILLRRKAC